MKKRVSKKIRVRKYVQPEQLRRTLVMTAREYMKTPEYQEKAKKRFEELIKPKLKYFETMAKQINQQMNFLGIPQAIKKIEKQYTSILKDYQSPPNEMFVSPRYNNPPSLTIDLIEKISEKSAEKVLNNLKKKTIKSPKITLFLTEDGDLYRNPKKTHYYSLRNEGVRLKILKILYSKYTDTNIIKSEAESSSASAIRKAIGEINRKAGFHLKLKRKLIESKPHSGYRINPTYTIRHIK